MYHIRSVRNILSRTHTHSLLFEDLCRVPVQAQQMPHQVVFPRPLAIDAVPYLLQEAQQDPEAEYLQEPKQ